MSDIGHKLHRLLLHVVLMAICIVTVFPLVWMVTAAFTPNDMIMARAVRFWPENPTLSNFAIAASRHPIWMWLWNSMLTATLITAGKLALSVPAGFAFGRLEFKGRQPLFWFVIATMSFPNVLAIIPTYIAVVKLQAFNTYGFLVA